MRPDTLAPLEDDLRRFAAARQAHGEPAGFMNAASPGVIALFQPDDYYHDEDAYLEALAEAMRPEYEAIVAAGLVLQLDSPDLGLGRHMMYADREESAYLRRIERHVAVLNPRCATFLPTGCGCTSAGATTRGRTIVTSRWPRSCPCC